MSDSQNISILNENTIISDLENDSNIEVNLSYDSSIANNCKNPSVENSTFLKQTIKEKNIAESPLKNDFQNSLKNIILKNLSEEKIGARIKKDNFINSNSPFDKNKSITTRNRPFSQNTNIITTAIEDLIGEEDKPSFDLKFKEYEINSSMKRRLLFNSLNNNISNSSKNKNAENLDLNNDEENPLTYKNKFSQKKQNSINKMRKTTTDINNDTCNLSDISIGIEVNQYKQQNNKMREQNNIHQKLHRHKNFNSTVNFDLDLLKKSVLNIPRPSSESSNNTLLLKKRILKNSNSSSYNLSIPFVSNSYNLENNNKISSHHSLNKNHDENSSEDKPVIISKIDNLSKIICINNNFSQKNINVNQVNDHSPIHLLNLENYSNNRNSTKFNKRVYLLSEKGNDYNNDSELSNNKNNSELFLKNLYHGTQHKKEKSFNSYTLKNSENDFFHQNIPNNNSQENLENNIQNFQINNDSLHILPEEGNLNKENNLNEDNSSSNMNQILIVDQEINNSNSNLENVQIKVPKLLNTITNLYDMNSERVKKRSQQMKKIKEKFETIDNQRSDLFNKDINFDFEKNGNAYSNMNLDIPKHISEFDQQLKNENFNPRRNYNLNSKDKVDKYGLIYQTEYTINIKNDQEIENQNLPLKINSNSNIKLASSKKYQEESENSATVNSNRESFDNKTTLPTLRTRYSGLNTDKDREKALFSGTSNTDADATDNNTNNDKAAEIVISDLECDLEDINDNINFKNEITNICNAANKNPINTSLDTYSNLYDTNIQMNQISSNNNLSNINLMQNLSTNLIIANSIANNKSFVPINNNLKEKNTFSNNKEKATPSYLMALYQYEETDPESFSKQTFSLEDIKSEQDIYNYYNNFPLNPNSRKNKYKNNYIVDNVIEEEASEHNTDMDLSGKKKNSFFNSKLNLSERPDNKSKEILIETNNNSYNSNLFSPFTQKRRNSLFNNSNSNHSNSLVNNNYNIINISVNGNPLNNNSILHNNNNSIQNHGLNNSLLNNNKRQSKSDNFNKDFLETQLENGEYKRVLNPCHKSSKSELLSIHLDMRNIVNNIHNKNLSNQGEKIEKIKMRKNYLIKTFTKSNSHHDFEKIYTLTKDSNETFNNFSSHNDSSKNFKFFLNGSPKAGTSFNSKKFTSSSISRAKFYDEFFEDIEEIDENKLTEQDLKLDNNEIKENSKTSRNGSKKNKNIFRNLNDILNKSKKNFMFLSCLENTTKEEINGSTIKKNNNSFRICPRYTLSQEKNGEKAVCKTDNNDVEKFFQIPKNKKIKKRPNNKSHHNLQTDLLKENLNLINEKNEKTFNAFNEQHLNIQNINWENEKETLDVASNYEKVRNLDYIKDNSADKNKYFDQIDFKIFKVKKNPSEGNKRKVDNNSKNKNNCINNINDEDLEHNIEYENINLVSLISCDSNGDAELDIKSIHESKEKKNEIHRKLSFIENIELEDYNNPNDSVILNKENSMKDLKEINNSNKIPNKKDIEISSSNRIFCDEYLENEVNIIYNGNDTETSKKEVQLNLNNFPIYNSDKNNNLENLQINLNTKGQTSSNKKRKLEILEGYDNELNSNKFNHQEFQDNDVMNINKCLVSFENDHKLDFHKNEQNFIKNENEKPNLFQKANDIELETCNFEMAFSNDFNKEIIQNEKNNFINYDFLDNQINNIPSNSDKVDDSNEKLALENINFNIDNFSPNTEKSKMNNITGTPEKKAKVEISTENLNWCTISNETKNNNYNVFHQVNRISESLNKKYNTENFSNKSINEINGNSNVLEDNNNALNKYNVFESQDMRLSDKFESQLIKKDVVLSNTHPKNYIMDVDWSKNNSNENNSDMLINESYQQPEESRISKIDNYLLNDSEDKAPIINSDNSKNTCLNFNEIFKNFEEPSNNNHINLHASKVSNLNLKKSTNSINSFINLAQTNTCNPTSKRKQQKSNNLLYFSQNQFNNNTLIKNLNLIRRVNTENTRFEGEKNINNQNLVRKTKHKSIDLFVTEGKKLEKIDEQSMLLLENESNLNEERKRQNKNDAIQDIELDYLKIKNASGEEIIKTTENKLEISIIDFPNTSSPFIIEKQKSFSGTKTETDNFISRENKNLMPDLNLFAQADENQIINNFNGNNFIKETEIIKGNVNKNLRNKSIKNLLETKIKKKFHAFNSEAILNRNYKGLNFSPSLKNQNERELIVSNNNNNLRTNEYSNNIKLNLFETLNSFGNFNTINNLEKNGRPNTLSPENNNLDFLDSENKRSKKIKAKNLQKNKIDPYKNKNDNNNKKEKFVKPKNLDKTPNFKKQNINPIDYNSDNKKIEDELFSLKNSSKKKANNFEISNAVNVEISGSDKFSTSIHNNNIINNNINNISISIVPGINNPNCANLNTIDIASLANYSSTQNFGNLNQNFSNNNYNTLTSNCQINNFISNSNNNNQGFNNKKSSHKSNLSITEDFKKKNIHQKVINNIKTLCEQQFRSNSSSKLILKKEKQNKKTIKNTTTNNKHSSQLKISNHNSSSTNFPNSAAANANSYPNDNFSSFQQKKIMKSHILNNRNNANKSARLISPINLPVGQNLNYNSTINYQINNSNFNLNSNNTNFNNNNNCQLFSMPNYNQILSNQGRNTKSDLKHLLVFSESGIHNNINTKKNNNLNYNNEKNLEIHNTSLINTKNKNQENQKISVNFNYSDKLDLMNYRVNSESSLVNFFSIVDSNKLLIMEVMKHLKYQFSSLDHQKMAMEKLIRSKSKNFCLLISEECSKKKIHEFKGLYESNTEKNILTKIYSCNYNPNICGVKEVKIFYTFDFESNEFKILDDVKNLISEMHAFCIPSNFNYKKFSK